MVKYIIGLVLVFIGSSFALECEEFPNDDFFMNTTVIDSQITDIGYVYISQVVVKVSIEEVNSTHIKSIIQEKYLLGRGSDTLVFKNSKLVPSEVYKKMKVGRVYVARGYFQLKDGKYFHDMNYCENDVVEIIDGKLKPNFDDNFEYLKSPDKWIDSILVKVNVPLNELSEASSRLDSADEVMLLKSIYK